MAVSQEIGVLVNAIRGSMGEASGEFRRAARSSESMTRIVKDIANVFNAQRRDLAELQNTLSESAFESEQSSSKLDHMSSLFREMLSVQTSTLGELRSIDAGVREMDKDIYALRYLMMNQNSSLGNLTDTVALSGKTIVDKLGTLALGAAAGVAGATAMGAFGGGGGEGGGGGGAAGGEGGGGAKTNTSPMSYNGSAGEAMSFFQSKGWSKEQAAGIVGNLQVESGNFSSDVISGKRKGDGGHAVGIGQWHEPRQAIFQNAFGKPLLGASFKEQLEFVNFELTHNESGAGNKLKQATTADQAARIIDNFYERPSKGPDGGHDKRIANAISLAGKNNASENSNVASNSQQSTITGATAGSAAAGAAVAGPSGATPQSQPMTSTNSAASGTPEGGESRALNPETMGGHGHGPISGPMTHGEKQEGSSAALPSGDIVSLGNALKKQGILVSEHPSFGGVKKGAHGPNSAHYDGMAIDINAPSGNKVEANDPVWGPKFDKLAQQIQAAGYTVLWRTRNHDNHIHAQIGGKGIRGGHSIIGGGAGKDQSTDNAGATPVTAPSPTTGMTPGPGPQTSTQGESAPSSSGSSGMSPGVSAPLYAAPEGLPQLGALAGALNQQVPGMMMGGMMGLGSLAGVLGPALVGLMTSNGAQMPEQITPESAPMPSAESMVQQPPPAAQIQEQPQNAELTQQLSEAAMNSQIVAQTAVQQKAQQEMAQEAQSPTAEVAQNFASSPSMGVTSSSGNDAGYAYNYPWDTAWPDWAAKLGGNHYMELHNIKKNMWG